MLLMQNASPLHPIVIDTLMNFQHRGQLSFIYLMNQKGDAACYYDEFGAFRIFLGAGLHGTLNHGVSVALSELD